MISSLRVPVLVLATTGAVTSQEGGIEIFAGETLYESGIRVSLTELTRTKSDLFRGSDDIADPLGQEIDELRSVVGLDYGFRRNSTISLLIPHVDRDTNLAGVRSSVSGIGDAALIGKYRLHQHEGSGESFNVSAIFGLELPTGATDEMQGGLRLAPAHQLGGGSTDPFAALAATADQGRARFDGVVFYKHNTEGAQNFDEGEFFSASISAAYRFLHFKYPGPTFGLRLGLQYRNVGRAESNGLPLPNSGSDELLFAPALSIHPIPRMDLVLGARIPIYQHYSGTQLGRNPDFILALGLRF